jgi:hypothetical protein
MMDYLNFKTLLATQLLKISYPIVAAIFTVWMMFGENIFIFNIFLALVGNVIIRVAYEGSMVIFSIHETLVCIQKAGEKSHPAT